MCRGDFSADFHSGRPRSSTEALRRTAFGLIMHGLLFAGSNERQISSGSYPKNLSPVYWWYQLSERHTGLI